MNRYHSYLNNAKQILEQYKGEKPFASFLKKYFSEQKKYGSTDRKQIAHLCYCYFRLGKSLLNTPIEERILISLFLCSNKPNEILQQLKPEWNKSVNKSLEEKCLMFNSDSYPDQYSIFNIFPWKNELSKGIDYESFCESFLIQPDLFIRLRPLNGLIARQKLQHAGIEFKTISDTCLALPNSSKIENIVEFDTEIVVQDYNSQQIGEIFKNLKPQTSNLKLTVWDCCAGSGGKSLLLYDISPDINLTVSDRRESILINLKKRFAKAGIKKYKSLVIDLAKESIQLPVAIEATINNQFSIIIADVPCTGSGTWSRTPEQLYYFDESKIREYASLQKKIASNIISHLQPGGYLLYTTCSVFKKENEEVVDYIRHN